MTFKTLRLFNFLGNSFNNLHEGSIKDYKKDIWSRFLNFCFQSYLQLVKGATIAKTAILALFEPLIGGPIIPGRFAFLQFSAAVFRFFTNIGTVFRFCRLLRFVEMDLFLTRFSALSYICSGFSVVEKCGVCEYLLPYCGLLFADIRFLIAARDLLSFPSLSRLALVRCSKRLTKLVQMNNIRTISFYTFDGYLSISGYQVDL